MFDIKLPTVLDDGQLASIELSSKTFGRAYYKFNGEVPEAVVKKDASKFLSYNDSSVIVQFSRQEELDEFIGSHNVTIKVTD